MNATSHPSIEQLLKVGGRRWQKAGRDRIYFNRLTDWYGLSRSYYGTGNVSSATVDGQKISNNSARKLLSALELGKLWYDIAEGGWRWQGMAESTAEKLIERIEEAARGAQASQAPSQSAAGWTCPRCGGPTSVYGQPCGEC